MAFKLGDILIAFFNGESALPNVRYSDELGDELIDSQSGLLIETN